MHVNLTEQGRAKAKQQREDMRDAVCWVFSQMGERRTREFVDLTEEFATYVTICIPGQPRPTAEEVSKPSQKPNLKILRRDCLPRKRAPHMCRSRL